MSNIKLIKKAGLIAAVSMLPLSQAVMAEASWNISGWINEGVTYFDDGVDEGVYQNSENGHTLGSRISLTGAADLANSGLSSGFEVILEPQSSGEILGAGTSEPTLGARAQQGFSDENIGYAPDILGNGSGHTIRVLSTNVHVAGAFGKVTVGLQSMPTDNIAVLEDPSLTLWSAISPVFVGNFTAVTGLAAGTTATWNNFLTCGSGIGGIGIDCNGIYRKGIRYDLPSFGPVNVAIGAANNDVYDIAAKYKGSWGRVNTSLALGYAKIASGNAFGGQGGVDNFQLQAGVIDPTTGLFGSIAYQNEDMDSVAAGRPDDSTDAWWIKAGIKKAWNSLGDTSFSVNYGQYNDQYGAAQATAGVTGSEVERIGFEVNQYFGSKLIIYGVYEQLDLSVDGGAGAFSGANELDTFRTGLTFFF